MAVSSQDIRRLRRMVAERNDENYSDAELAIYIESWPLVDENGRTIEDGDNWHEEYDLHAAAAEIWTEKAAAVANKHDFNADGASFQSSQLYNNAIKQSNHHRALQKAQIKFVPLHRRTTYFPDYANPIYDEDEPGEDMTVESWRDSIV